MGEVHRPMRAAADVEARQGGALVLLPPAEPLGEAAVENAGGGVFLIAAAATTAAVGAGGPPLPDEGDQHVDCMAHVRPLVGLPGSAVARQLRHGGDAPRVLVGEVEPGVHRLHEAFSADEDPAEPGDEVGDLVGEGLVEGLPPSDELHQDHAVGIHVHLGGHPSGGCKGGRT